MHAIVVELYDRFMFPYLPNYAHRIIEMCALRWPNRPTVLGRTLSLFIQRLNPSF